MQYYVQCAGFHHCAYLIAPFEHVALTIFQPSIQMYELLYAMLAHMCGQILCLLPCQWGALG